MFFSANEWQLHELELPESETLFNTHFPNNLIDLLIHTTEGNERLTVNPSTPDEFEMFGAACNYSNVATLLYVLFHEPIHKFEGSTTIKVHVVGASTEVAVFTRLECWLLFRWLPEHIRYITIHFVGPDLPAEIISYSKIKYESMPTDKIVNLHYHRETYEAFMATATEANVPHAILCFNSGFSEFDGIPDQINPWIAALDLMLLKAKDIPIAFTSYNKSEANDDMNLLQRRANELSSENAPINLSIIFDGIENPYRDLRPYRNWANDSEEEMFYYNGYLNVFMVKKL